jgi:hypothetical protein
MADRKVYCRGCGGFTWADPQSGAGEPLGWYSLSVNQPADQTRSGRPFQWLGMYCCLSCLEMDMSRLFEEETISRRRFEAVVPAPNRRQP